MKQKIKNIIKRIGEIKASTVYLVANILYILLVLFTIGVGIHLAININNDIKSKGLKTVVDKIWNGTNK